MHINEPGRTEWEGFATATQAAAAGGVTTLVDMPLNCMPETIDESALEAKRKAASGKAWVDWAAWGGVVRGNAEQLPGLIQCGVPGFKCFLIHSGIDGFAWVNEADLRLALEKLRGSGLPLLVHAEVAAPVNAATEALERCACRLAKIFHVPCIASRRGGARGDCAANSFGRGVQHPYSYCSPSERKGAAAAGRCTRAWLAHYRGDLHAVSVVWRRRNSRWGYRVQMRAPDPRFCQSGRAVEGTRIRPDRFCGNRPFALPSGHEAAR